MNFFGVFGRQWYLSELSLGRFDGNETVEHAKLNTAIREL